MMDEDNMPEPDGQPDRVWTYDVAFSFLAEDEPTAVALDDLLRGRLDTFLYSRRQDVVAGTDGEATFNKVFGSEARAVVVLHRPGWGETPFTRVEATALRNRAFEEGYDFCLFIPMTADALPRWVPKNRIWIGLERWGLEGAASVIEARVQDLGGSPHPETAVDRALRMEHDVQAAEARDAFLQSEGAVEAADAAFNDLVESLRSVAAALKGKGSPVTFETREFSVVLQGRGYSALASWYRYYRNSLDESAFRLTLRRGRLSLEGNRFTGEPTDLVSRRFEFTLDAADRPGWRERGGRGDFFSVEDMSSEVVTLLDNALRRA